MKNEYLGDFLGKNVEIVDIDGKRWTGHVAVYDPAIDRDEDEPQEDAIGLRLEPTDRDLVDFNASEIKSIHIIN